MLYGYLLASGAPYDLHLTSLIGLFATIGGSDVFGAMDSADLFRHDWLSVALPRLTIFERYPAATALLALAFGSAACLRARGRPTIVLCEAILLLFAISLITRSLWIGFAVGSTASLLALFLRRYAPIVIGALAAAIMIIPLFNPASILESAQDARQGSTSARMELYRSALEVNESAQFIFGHGGKVHLEGSSGVKVGSHSSVLGSFFKGGAPLAAVYLAFLGVIALQAGLLMTSRSASYKDFVVARFVLMFAIWSLFEDFDASPLAGALTGVFLGELGVRLAAKRRGKVRDQNPLTQHIRGFGQNATS